MTLFDIDSESIVTLQDLKKEWLTMETDESFIEYLCNVLQDTINDRNNCDILYMTRKEIDKYFTKLIRKLEA